MKSASTNGLVAAVEKTTGYKGVADAIVERLEMGLDFPLSLGAKVEAHGVGGRLE